jgi:hypothetical protein
MVFGTPNSSRMVAVMSTNCGTAALILRFAQVYFPETAFQGPNLKYAPDPRGGKFRHVRVHICG